MVADSCAQVLAELRLDLPHSLQNISQFQLYMFTDRGWLHNIAPVAGTPRNVDGASVGGGFRLGLTPGVTVDLSAAKAVHGPRDDLRFFSIVTGRF